MLVPFRSTVNPIGARLSFNIGLPALSWVSLPAAMNALRSLSLNCCTRVNCFSCASSLFFPAWESTRWAAVDRLAFEADPTDCAEILLLLIAYLSFGLQVESRATSQQVRYFYKIGQILHISIACYQRIILKHVTPSSLNSALRQAETATHRDLICSSMTPEDT